MKNILHDLLAIPKKMKADRSVSVVGLLNESGFFHERFKLHEKDFYQIILKDPSLASEWIAYSEDKRSDTGWYFSRDEKQFLIGYILNGKEVTSKRRFFSDIKAACAAYVCEELSEMQGIGMSGE